MNDGLSELPRDGGMQNCNTLVESIQDYRKKTWTSKVMPFKPSDCKAGWQICPWNRKPWRPGGTHIMQVLLPRWGSPECLPAQSCKTAGEEVPREERHWSAMHVPILQSHQSIHCFCLRIPVFGDKVVKFSVEPGDQEVRIWQLPTATQVLEHPRVNEQRKSACQLYTSGIYMADRAEIWSSALLLQWDFCFILDDWTSPLHWKSVQGSSST